MLSRALSLAAAILVARTLGKVVYGELGIIQSTVGMFGTLAGFGMGTTSSKFVAEFRFTFTKWERWMRWWTLFARRWGRKRWGPIRLSARL